MGTERVHLREIDLTRHVKTPAGVKYFHKPIGSPIGKSTGHRIAKAAEHTVKLVEDGNRRDAARATTKATRVKPTAKSLGIRVGDSPSARAQASAARAEEAARRREPNARYKVRVGEHGTTIDKINPPAEYSHAPLSKGEARRVEEILNNARTPDDIHAALLKATMAQKYHLVRRVVAQSKAAHDYLEKNGDQLEHGSDATVARILNKVGRLTPWIRDAIDKVRTSDKAQRLRDFKYVESIADAAMDTIIKAAFQGGMLALGSMLGVKLFGVG